MSDRRTCIDPAVGGTMAAYEAGLLDAPASVAAEEHLARCESCRETLFEMAPFAAAMATEPAPIRRRVSELSEARAESSIAHRVRAFVASLGARPAFALVPVAAALVLVVTLRDDGISSLARIEPVPYVPMATRGSSAEAAFTAGMLAYANGDWTAAAARLEQVSAPGSEVTFYLGLSRLLAGREDDAIEPLSAVAASDSPILADRARWYLAQAHLLRDERQEAEGWLRGLADGSPGYAKDAAGILAELEKVR